MKSTYLISALVLFMSSVALGQNLSLNLPSAPDTNGRDSIRGPDIDCSASIDSATKLEFGVIYSGNESESERVLGKTDETAGIYARVVMPLGGGPKTRLDCNRLYELELERRQLEIRSLRMQLNQLENLEFEE